MLYAWFLVPGAITCPAPLQAAADAAREAGTILFVVGVGFSSVEGTLLDIAGGDEDRVFSVDNFDELDGEFSSFLFALPFLDFSGALLQAASCCSTRIAPDRPRL